MSGSAGLERRVRPVKLDCGSDRISVVHAPPAGSPIIEPVADEGEGAETRIRALSRGLAVLQVVNRNGSARMMDICREAEIPYPTAYRIVQTLIDEGMIEREESRKRYRPTALVRTLSYGYQDKDDLVTSARPHIVQLCKDVNWPISLATRVGNMMMVQDSTHSLTSLTFNNYSPGYTLPLIQCSTGKAYLAFCDDEERATVVAGFSQLTDASDRMARLFLRDTLLLEDIRRKGYATQARNLYTANPGKTSSIAAPLMADGKLRGCIAIIWFASAMSMSEAEAAFADKVRSTASAISGDIAAGRAQ